MIAECAKEKLKAQKQNEKLIEDTTRKQWVYYRYSQNLRLFWYFLNLSVQTAIKKQFIIVVGIRVIVMKIVKEYIGILTWTIVLEVKSY